MSLNTLTRDRMIDILVDHDIQKIGKDMEMGDFSFLDAVLRGEGFTQYKNLTDDQLVREYLEYTSEKLGV